MAQIAPAVPQKRRRFSFFLFVVAFGLAVLTFFAKTHPYFRFDLVITLLVQRINFFVFEQLMYLMTFLGNYPTVFILPILVSVALFGFRKRRESLMLFISTYGVIVVSEILKRIVARPRPDGTLIIQVGQFVRNDSFPSGHVLFAIGFFGFLAYIFYISLKKGWKRNTIIGFLMVLTILMGFSRIYLGAHWFSDTLGSYLLGTLWLYLMVNIYHRIKLPVKIG